MNIKARRKLNWNGCIWLSKGQARAKQTNKQQKSMNFPEAIKGICLLWTLLKKKKSNSLSNYTYLWGNSPKFPQLGDWSESQMCTSDFTIQTSPLISYKPFNEFLAQHHRKNVS